MAGEKSASGPNAVKPHFQSGLMVPSLVLEARAASAYKKTHIDAVKVATTIDVSDVRSPTSLVTPTMNDAGQMHEVNPFAGQQPPQYLDQVHKARMYYEVAEKRNAALTAVIPSPAPASTGPKGSVSGNDFNKLMGGGYQTDWVDAQGKPKGANGGKKGKRRTKPANPGMGLFRNNDEDGR